MREREDSTTEKKRRNKGRKCEGKGAWQTVARLGRPADLVVG